MNRLRRSASDPRPACPTTPRREAPPPSLCLRPRVVLLAAALLALPLLVTPACLRNGAKLNATAERVAAYPSIASPRVIAIANLQPGGGATASQNELSRFLFGTATEAPLGLLKPSGVAPRGRELLVCDTVRKTVLHWVDDGNLTPLHLSPEPTNPIAVRSTPAGEMLIIDAAAKSVLRYDSAGELITRYTFAADAFRPTGVADLGDRVWVSNAALHRIEVFDSQTGKHLRAIGRRGTDHGEFRAPLGLARTPDGNVCVVDTLNARVQLLSPRGDWLRDIGTAGDRVGRFGRPKDVAVGPDGTIFVVDDASQRVHAFDAQGNALLAFGQPRPGADPLMLPGAVAVANESPMGDVEPGTYYVLVAEQLHDPGIRVYAWRTHDSDSSGPRARASTDPVANTNSSPHWSAGKCAACHKMQDGEPLPIPAQQVDQLCLSCHDGVKAASEAHPIGIAASSAHTKIPSDWPTSDGALGCLTCHDIQQHCDTQATRPSSNVAALRGIGEHQATDFCGNCHTSDPSWRISPHQQLSPGGSADLQSCLFCHNAAPSIPPDGARRGAPDLRTEGSALCLTCHVRHWDYAPGGHVDREAPPRILERMRSSSQVSGASRQMRFPLHDGRVVCYSCHNPHQAGLFPTGSELGMLAAGAADRALRLRKPQLALCLHCHEK